MRKNNFNSKRIGVFTVYTVSGTNVSALLNLAKAKKITLFDIKKGDKKQVIVSVSLKQSLKFFAIAKELCYNIKKIGYKGRAYPLYELTRSLGVIVGALIFIATAIFSSDYVFSVEYVGSGSIYKGQIEKLLIESGVERFTRFSSVDLRLVEDYILAKNSNLTFVSCYKNGNRLVVDSATATKEVEKLTGKEEKMLSNVSGVVKDIKVYRGTAMVGVGDRVEVGTLLVDGVVTVKEEQIKINVIASATIHAEIEYSYILDEGKEEHVKALAIGETGDKEIILITVEKIPYGQKFNYAVKVVYKQVVTVG